MKCHFCGKEIPLERVSMGYTECTKCKSKNDEGRQYTDEGIKGSRQDSKRVFKRFDSRNWE